MTIRIFRESGNSGEISVRNEQGGRRRKKTKKQKKPKSVLPKLFSLILNGCKVLELIHMLKKYFITIGIIILYIISIITSLFPVKT